MWRELKAALFATILIEGGQSTTEASLAYVGLLDTSSSARTCFPERVMGSRNSDAVKITSRSRDVETLYCERAVLCGSLETRR
jgi:hypothetical protein